MNVALKVLPVAQPGIERVGLGYLFTPARAEGGVWPVRFHVDRLRETKDELTAEVLIQDVSGDKPEHLQLGRFNLQSTTTRATWAKHLRQHCEGTNLAAVPWDRLIEQLAVGVIRREREGEPTQHVRDLAAIERAPDTIERLLPARKPTLWFGPQGAGKGWLAVLACTAVAGGVPFAGLRVGPATPCLYLDWEDDAPTFRDRVMAAMSGLGMNDWPDIHYRKMRGLFSRHLHRTMRDIAELRIGLVVIDSVGLAAGTPGEGGRYEDVALQFFDALSYLSPATVLLIDHVAGEQAQGAKLAGKAFGSIYKMAEARAAWEIRKEQESESAEQLIGMYHTKFNHTAKHRPVALRLKFVSYEDTLEAVHLSTADIRHTTELVTGLSQPEQIEAFLLRDGPSTIAAVGDAVRGKDGNAVGETQARVVLHRLLKRARVVRLEDGRWAMATAQRPQLRPIPFDREDDE